ncbi:MAG: TIGR03086 family protein [Candidatus Dormibacteraeota bacterium]|uniref:TIGR03086 family protein n=1 Tax=Candidatus Amunia macphersoniae TaxID=3127014 RepID=A0A934KHW9_9BACT|nr:TIGR03086 family protein [Candidatus Dormibacteraeota bacterium]
MDDAVWGIEEALQAIDPVMTAVTTDDLDKASPCDGWTVGNVTTHLLNGLNERAAAAAGTGIATVDDAATLNDVPAAWRNTRERLLAALQAPGAMDREVRGPGGRTVPLRMLVKILPIEVMLHGWDIARGSGGSTDLDPQLAARLLETGRPLIAQFGRGTAFGPEQPAPADAPAADRLAAFYGRRLGG